MDEALEVVDVVADSGFEGIVTWLLRLVDLVLLVAPSILLLAAEFA